jgi:glycosyltransferase involved in cell wall biosynthesis
MTGSRRSRGSAGRRLRVAIAMPGGFEFGGIGRMMLYATRGWQGAPDAPEWWLVDARGNGRLIWSPFHLLRAIIGLMMRRPDLLHLNIANKGSTLRKLALSIVAARLRIPTIMHLHFGVYAEDLARRPVFVQRQVAAMFRRAELVLVLGQNDARMAADVLGVARERIRVLHNAVPDPGPPPVRAGREGPVQLLFLGRFDAPDKGVPELLSALATPDLQARDWHLVVAGRGERAALAPALERPGIARRVTFTGWLPQAEVYALCRAADIFVLPSFHEGQAMSLLEAMAHGLAIVTTPVGAHQEAVEDGTQALLVQPGDVAALAAALSRLIDNFALRDALGSAARRKYCGSFDAVQYSKALLQIYGRVRGE